jgi:hypothetical protein
MLTRANFSRRVRVKGKPVMPIAEMNAEVLIRYLVFILLMKKASVMGGRRRKE